jgi:hypothetical protein
MAQEFKNAADKGESRVLDRSSFLIAIVTHSTPRRM